MGLFKCCFNIGLYFAALIGFLALIPLPPFNSTFTKYSVVPAKPLTGSLALNEKLSGAKKLFENQLKGPEGLAYHEGFLYTTIHGGHVVKIYDDKIIPVMKFGKLCDGLYEEHLCGRPLGLTFDSKGALYIADCYNGIFKVNVSSTDQKEHLVTMNDIIEGKTPKIPNSVAVASDGTVYWTDSDTNHALHDGIFTMLVDGTGRLVKYDPKSKKNTVLLNNLQFANGIALSDDESFIIVAETLKFRIHKYYLKGPKAQKSEIFVDGLPGMPDNLKSNKRGSFYVPLVISRTPYLDDIGSYPNLRMIFAKLLGVLDFTLQTMDFYYPNIYFKKAYHWVGHFESISFPNKMLTILKINENGVITSSFHSTKGDILNICDIEIVGDKLYLGSPFNNYLGVVDLPKDFI
ncbi:adipocyte plasma membrane-associated protein Hemomucin isoform X2 [Daktulosphaira vitifoliae]|uniref:adipocyte plasma membrane-associated protein Hemomucin isoform X2 n=1 Tax=Daktulosphaira vitifoliae TaxID=58002 RepID=UPI0021A9D16D|nr:adipocyte plasma membrane-associated protein Hemomucin isoform X2 [Daktulosphaira vitifoliae]